MTFPYLTLQREIFVDYYIQENFLKLVFQFRISFVFDNPIVTLVCYCMNDHNQPMHDNPIILQNIEEFKNFEIPLNMGNLELYYDELPKIVGEKNNLKSFRHLLFIPNKVSLDYIGYDIYRSLQLQADVTEVVADQADGEMNPCPPARCREIIPTK